MLVLAIWTILSPMARISSHKAAPFLVVLLFLEIGCLIGIVLVLSLVLGFLLELEILLLHQICARISLVSLHTCVLCPRLLFNIKRSNKTSNAELLSLVF